MSIPISPVLAHVSAVQKVREDLSLPAVQYVSEVWMRAQYFDLLDDFRAQLGGNYAVMARRVDGRWVKLGDIWSWLDSSGYRMTEADE